MKGYREFHWQRFWIAAGWPDGPSSDWRELSLRLGLRLKVSPERVDPDGSGRMGRYTLKNWDVEFLPFWTNGHIFVDEGECDEEDAYEFVLKPVKR